MLYELSERPWILLIGADGQLGWELRRTASPLGDVFATVENASRRRNVSGDLLDCAAIRRAFGIVLDDWRLSLERVMEEVLEVRRRPGNGVSGRRGVGRGRK